MKTDTSLTDLKHPEGLDGVITVYIFVTYKVSALTTHSP